MVFSSHLFLFYFLPVALLLYFASPRRGRNAVLTILSYVFYGWSNPFFCLLLLFSTTVDYFCGLTIEGAGTGDRARRRRKTALVVSIVTNLSLLGFFKYFNFAVDSYASLMHLLGLGGIDPSLFLRVTLPLGISFYTFQSMSYTIDVYRGEARAIRNPLDFACYVSMFPQLVAGPIIRFSEVADQLRNRTHSRARFAHGCAFFILGFAKKILLANPSGRIADHVFNAAAPGLVDAWWGAAAYAFQIYFDFSGYSDMAIGLGLMLGFVFPKNFDSPYLSRSITEFWRRWHMSLSSWLRDYLYIPLGGNRKGPRRTYVNLMIVMLLGGLWHGAAWNFVVWGGIHGILLSWERFRGRKSLYSRFPLAVQTAVTFVLLLFTWVFFRADDIGHALRYAGAMLGLVPASESSLLIRPMIFHPLYVGAMLLAAGITWFAPQTPDWVRVLTPAKAVVLILLFAGAVAVMTVQGFNPFIYFIF